jgi:hypothetical protein
MMLRNFIATFAITVALFGCASAQPISEADRTFDRVVDAPGYTQDQIYNFTKIWIAQNFKSAKSVIELDSKEDGIIIGNGIINYPCTGMDCMVKSDWRVPFTMRVDIKNEKFRVSFLNIRLSWPSSYSSGMAIPAYDGPVNTQGHMDEIKPALLKFGDELLASMGATGNSNDW